MKTTSLSANITGETTLILVPTPMEAELLFGTTITKEILCHFYTVDCIKNKEISVALCGFGLSAAAALSAFLIAKLQPQKVILIGIAGTYNPDIYNVADSLYASSLRCHGIGAKIKENCNINSKIINIPQIAAYNGISEIYDLIELAPPEGTSSGGFLSVTAASADLKEAKDRFDLNPSLVGEEMEGFGVALSCKLAGCEFIMIRGCSNIAGDREKKSWKIEAALIAAKKQLEITI